MKNPTMVQRSIFPIPKMQICGFILSCEITVAYLEAHSFGQQPAFAPKQPFAFPLLLCRSGLSNQQLQSPLVKAHPPVVLMIAPTPLLLGSSSFHKKKHVRIPQDSAGINECYAHAWYPDGCLLVSQSEAACLGS